jgi:D-alanine-D-alanine ligase
MKKNIAVMYGGDSSEYEVSVGSGQQVSAHLDRTRYNVYEILVRARHWTVQGPPGEDGAGGEIDKSDFSFLHHGQKVVFDCAFIVIHGTPGEDGLLQSYFDMLGIPYTSCNAFVSTLTFNKYATKCFLRDAGIRMAKDCYLRQGQEVSFDRLEQQLHFPMFVKPNASGSSFGVTKVKRPEDLPQALDSAFRESPAVIVEECIRGRELQQGVFKAGGQITALPVTEIVTENEFFDYNAKYNGQSQEITPAAISPELAACLTRHSTLIYDYLGCSGIVRIDYIVPHNEPWFLEINTVPGMSSASIVPQQIRAAGLQLSAVCTQLIEECLNSKFKI